MSRRRDSLVRHVRQSCNVSLTLLTKFTLPEAHCQVDRGINTPFDCPIFNFSCPVFVDKCNLRNLSKNKFQPYSPQTISHSRPCGAMRGGLRDELGYAPTRQSNLQNRRGCRNSESLAFGYRCSSPKRTVPSETKKPLRDH